MTIAKRIFAALAVAGMIIGITGATYAPVAEPDFYHQITLIADGQTRSFETRAATLQGVLDELSIRVDADDKVFPDPDTPVYAGMKARVIRVTVKDVTVNEAIARQTIRKATANLRPGHSKLGDAGADGLRKVTYRLTHADGERVMKQQLSAETVREARPRVVLYGKGSSLPSRGFFSRKVMVMTATAYDPGPRSCGPYADGRTSTGMKAGKGVVAVDPRVIPLGTKLFIEGYGFAVAGDTGGAIRGKKIDLGHNTYTAALRFGRRSVVVHILDE